jgi:hypothetical protein
MLKWFNDSNCEVTFANDYVVHIKYDNIGMTENVPLGSPVIYDMSTNWWGYVGNVVATFATNLTYELIVRYDYSVAGFKNTMDAYDYFNEIL